MRASTFKRCVFACPHSHGCMDRHAAYLQVSDFMMKPKISEDAAALLSKAKQLMSKLNRHFSISK